MHKLNNFFPCTISSIFFSYLFLLPFFKQNLFTFLSTDFAINVRCCFFLFWLDLFLYPPSLSVCVFFIRFACLYNFFFFSFIFALSSERQTVRKIYHESKRNSTKYEMHCCFLFHCDQAFYFYTFVLIFTIISILNYGYRDRISTDSHSRQQ